MLKTLSPAARELLRDFVNRNIHPAEGYRTKSGLIVPPIQGGAVTASGLYFPTWRDILDTTQLAIDLDLETHKIALFTNTITPNFSSDTAYGVAPYNANEVSGTGWAAGGVVLTTTIVDESPTGTLRWDADNVSETGTTLTNARFGLIYADALAGNNAIVGINFGSDYSTVSGTMAINFASGGILTIDLTP